MRFKNTRRTFFTVGFFVLLCAGTQAQTKTSESERNRVFDGTWQLDTRYVKQYGKQLFVVASEGSQLRIKKSQEFNRVPKSWELILFTDKKGEKNVVPDFFGKSIEVESKTRWSEDKIERTFSQIPTKGPMKKYVITEEYKIYEEGNSLNLTVSQCDTEFYFPTNAGQMKSGCIVYSRIYRRVK